MQEFSYIADHVLFESMHIGDSQKFAEIPRDPHSSLRGGQKKNKKTILFGAPSSRLSWRHLGGPCGGLWWSEIVPDRAGPIKLFLSSRIRRHIDSTLQNLYSKQLTSSTAT